MTETLVFPTIHDVLVEGDNIRNMIAGGTIKAGMVVCYADTGVDDTVIAGLPTVGMPAGVALYDAVTDGLVAVAGNDCVVYVAEGPGTGTDAGHYVMLDDDAAGGMVIEWDPAVTAHVATQATAQTSIVGQMIADLAANGTARMLVKIIPVSAYHTT